ncbi:CobD/CbiB family cobalamin biosynthesis protein [Desulfovibrio legallii]|uniref:Cobalamin biosynthesis protein CobD n=1 Tax=Desulfovibrio legallii TaxID=571438 RepID=A0A1G7HUU9_9BACT|nr:CobD/CbiB family cobalamin biosynthesis protein [Desulfovibrio legallii]SDF04113.1 adenosylcobinamide-phosphate synthase [Desulfovibrio legallii]
MSAPFAALPFSVWDCWWLAPVALLLDLWLGDPDLPWRHPVCLLGRLLDALEGPARRFMDRNGPAAAPRRGRLVGGLALAGLTGLTGLTVWGLVSVPLLGTALAVYLAWAGLALGSLARTGREVLRRVETAPEPEARAALSWLVSRETARMDRPLMRKTLADTLAENLTDAFTAPFFWLLLAGPVGLWCYKAVSTADSMWGYLTEKWRWLGFAGARGDDLLAYAPARLSALMAWLTDAAARGGACCGLWRRPWDGRWPGLRLTARQAAGMPSPNSGWSMAACAWLCRGRMAGPSVYFGALVDKPWLGPPPEEAAPWDEARLGALLTLVQACALCGGLALWLFFLVLG